MAKRIYTIMQVRDLGEVNITFKPGKGNDWVVATTMLDITVQSRFSGRDKKKTRQYALQRHDMNRNRLTQGNTVDILQMLPRWGQGLPY